MRSIAIIDSLEESVYFSEAIRFVVSQQRKGLLFIEVDLVWGELNWVGVDRLDKIRRRKYVLVDRVGKDILKRGVR